MTTNIIIRTNGRYVSEGTLSVQANGGTREEKILVGPGTQTAPAEQAFNVPHGSGVRVDIREREATPEEVAAVTQGAGGPVGDFQGGEFVEKKPRTKADDK